MPGYRISDAARRIGLPTSTLRYYERIGLLPRVRRTDGGYRTYDERSIERLTFIARARALGLRLNDIGELARLWDGGRCGPVQTKLRGLIRAKVAETRERGARLTARSIALSALANGPETATPDAPCNERCACVWTDWRISVSERRAITLPSDIGPAFACTLDPDEAGDRVTEWQALAAAAATRTSVERGVRLTFVKPNLGAVAELVAREMTCCPFLSFEISVSSSGMRLDVLGPSDARPLIEALV